ncbi:MAG: tyrosine-type recombinase/integrase, partial [Verrucomicrobiae bacterium]|nr:tyrosine-type recombinase/integrase [Verrucomicrobiae bacterium]
HYYASKLIEKGKDLKFIQSRMGHSRIETTLNIYGHLMKNRDEEHKLTAQELADELL